MESPELFLYFTLRHGASAPCSNAPLAGNNCYCFVTAEGLGAVAICDKEYPARVAVTMLKETITAFCTETK